MLGTVFLEKDLELFPTLWTRTSTCFSIDLIDFVQI